MAKKALGNSEEGEDMASLARKALQNVDHMSPQDRSEIAILAKKALGNMQNEGGDNL